MSGIKQATADRIDSCPTCGESIEASLKVYLDDVVIERRDGRVQVVYANDSSAHLGCEIEYYGRNDCCTEAINDHLNTHRLWAVRIDAADFNYKLD